MKISISSGDNIIRIVIKLKMHSYIFVMTWIFETSHIMCEYLAFYLGWCHLNNLYYLMLSRFDCLRCPVPSIVLLHCWIETIKQVTTKYKRVVRGYCIWAFFCRDSKIFFNSPVHMCIVSFASFCLRTTKKRTTTK